MEKIWVLLAVRDKEGQEIIGMFSNQEKAEKMLDEKEYLGFGGYDGYYIHEFEVK